MLHAMRPMLVASLLLLGSAAPAWSAAPAPAPKPWEVAVKGGAAVFLGSQSKALPHLIKPMLRAELSYLTVPRLRLGIEVVAIPEPNANYRLIGAYLLARGALWDGPVFKLWLKGGFGAGSAPRILFGGLTRDQDGALWGQMALAFVWTAVPDLLTVGVEVVDDNLTVLSLNASIGVAF